MYNQTYIEVQPIVLTFTLLNLTLSTLGIVLNIFFMKYLLFSQIMNINLKFLLICHNCFALISSICSLIMALRGLAIFLFWNLEALLVTERTCKLYTSAFSFSVVMIFMLLVSISIEMSYASYKFTTYHNIDGVKQDSDGFVTSQIKFLIFIGGTRYWPLLLHWLQPVSCTSILF